MASRRRSSVALFRRTKMRLSRRLVALMSRMIPADADVQFWTFIRQRLSVPSTPTSRVHGAFIVHRRPRSKSFVMRTRFFLPRMLRQPTVSQIIIGRVGSASP